MIIDSPEIASEHITTGVGTGITGYATTVYVKTGLVINEEWLSFYSDADVEIITEGEFAEYTKYSIQR